MRRRTTSALIRRAVDACREAGVEVGAIEVRPGGVVRILAPHVVADNPAEAQEGENTCDALFGAESD